MTTRLLLPLVLGLIATLTSAVASACKCKMNDEAWEESVVMRGIAVEWMEGEPGSQGSPAFTEDTAMATRYLVEKSNRLEPGAEAIVFGRFPSGGNCGISQVPVGHRGVIVARERGGVLITTRCVNSLGDAQPEILRKLGLPPSWTSHWHSEPLVGTGEECTRPESLADALEKSEIAAEFLGSGHTCWSPEESRVVRYLYPELSWKGEAGKGWLRVSDSPERRGDAFRLDRDVVEATRHYEWPWAAFLRRSGDAGASTDRYERSVCFAPSLPVADSSVLISALNETLPLPVNWRERGREQPRTLEKPPPLSCARMDAKTFDQARSMLAEAEQEQRRSRHESKPGAHAAGCGVVSASPPTFSLLLLVLACLGGGLVRRRWQT